MFGAFRPAAGLSRPAFLTFMVLAGLGTLLTAAYLLLVVRRVCMGGTPAVAEAVPAVEEGTATAAEAVTEVPAAPSLVIPDLARYEYAAWTPLAVLTVLAGLWPAALLGLTDPAVQQLLGGGK